MTSEPDARCGTDSALLSVRMSFIPRKAGGDRKRNRFSGYCFMCGWFVEEGDGCISKDDSGKWIVMC